MQIKKKSKKVIITKNNYTEASEYFNQFDTAVLFGKGESFYDRPKQDNELYLCGNNAINHLSECDILIMNDIIATELIDPESYSKVKYIMIPIRPHYTDGKPKPNISHLDFINNIKDYYDGDYIITGLPTSKNEAKNAFNLSTTASVINTGIDFIGAYTNIKKIETYGFAKSGIYCDEIKNSGKKFSDYVYKDNWIKFLSKTYEKQKNMYNFVGNIN
jgi:hypothetical protein